MTGGAPVAVDWFGVAPEAVAAGRSSHLAVARWRLDRDEQSDFRASAMPGTHLVCAHLSGRIEWAARFDDRRYARPCLPGPFTLAQAGESAEITLSRAHASFVHFYLPAQWFAERHEEIALGAAGGGLELIDAINGHSAAVHACPLAAARALREGGIASRLEIEAAALLLAATLIRHHSNARSGPPLCGGLAPWQVRLVGEAMVAAKDRGERAASLTDLARLVGLSATHFCRAFAQSTGQPPHRWMTERRIERAKALLADPRISLTEVAFELGYANQSAFGRMFARVVGTTPSKWRRAQLS